MKSFFNKIYLYRTGNALGDALMLSYVAKAVKNKYPHKEIHCVSRFSALYENNPNIFSYCQLKKSFPDRLSAWPIPFINFIYYEKYFNPPEDHLLNLSLKSIGMDRSSNPRPEIFLSEKEEDTPFDKFSLPRKYIVTHSECGSLWSSGNKDWGQQNWQSAVNQIKDKIAIVQVGGEADHLLENTIDLRGNTSIRELAAVMKGAELFMGQEGGLHHVAAAVNTKSVIVFGSWIDPKVSSYVGNIDIIADKGCFPCYSRERCLTCRDAMESISVDSVCKSVAALL